MLTGKWLVIYNPDAGKGKGQKIAQTLSRFMRAKGAQDIILFEAVTPQYVKDYVKEVASLQAPFSCLVIGGDGTLGTVVDAVASAHASCAIAVYPAGTANDFATSCKVPKRKRAFVRFLESTTPQSTDIMCVNGKYMIHALGVGNFTNGAVVYSQHLKKWLGKLGYYAKCLKDASTMKSAYVSVHIDDKIYSGNYFFFYIVNAPVAGGFRKFAPEAQANDGYFDFIGFKACKFTEFTEIFLKLLSGKHIQHKKVVYVKGKVFDISTQTKNPRFQISDIDGNVGASLPLHAEVVHKPLKIYRNIN